MQLKHVFAARRLMQPVDVLGDYGLQLALGLQPGQAQMGRVGPGVFHNELIPIELVKLLGVLFKKRMRENGFGRVVVFLMIQAIHTAEIGDAALG